MNFKILFIILLIISFNSKCYADEGLDIRYKLPLVPLEFSFSSYGIKVNSTKTIVTPLGSFSLGYSKYAHKFDDEYTYVVIEDLNLKKEHIYKVNNKKTLNLISEGRTEIQIKDKMVRITLDKGSTFKVSFSIIGDDTPFQLNSKLEWIKPSKSVCKQFGGKVGSRFYDYDKNECFNNHINATTICHSIGGVLPSVEFLKEVATNCGGTVMQMSKETNKVWMANKANEQYQACYKRKGYGEHFYWTSNLDHRTNKHWQTFGFQAGLIDPVEEDLIFPIVGCVRKM